MELHELKKQVTLGVLPTNFIIFVNAKDSTFLTKQYMQAITALAAGGVNKVSSIYEPKQSSLLALTAADDVLNVVYTETFAERAEDYAQFENTIVVCDQIEKSIEPAVADFTIKMPNLQEWQILDHVKTLCKGIVDEDLLWLIRACNLNIDRVLNELDKVQWFSKEEQKQVFASICADRNNGFYKADLFKIVNAIVDGDLVTLYNFLLYGGADLLEPVVLANRAFSNLKAILLITQNPNVSAESLGVSAKQKHTLSRQYASIDLEAAKKKMKFLAEFDFALKTSKLDMSKQDMLSYLISNTAFKIIR
jgi:hypothetical protein